MAQRAKLNPGLPKVITGRQLVGSAARQLEEFLVGMSLNPEFDLVHTRKHWVFSARCDLLGIQGGDEEIRIEHHKFSLLKKEIAERVNHKKTQEGK